MLLCSRQVTLQSERTERRLCIRHTLHDRCANRLQQSWQCSQQCLFVLVVWLLINTVSFVTLLYLRTRYRQTSSQMAAFPAKLHDAYPLKPTVAIWVQL